MAYVRKQPKGFGRNALIEGDVPEGMRTLLVEDLTTDGGSKIRFAKALRDAGAICNHTFVVFFYGVFPGSFETLAQHGHHAAPSLHLVGRAGSLRRTGPISPTRPCPGCADSWKTRWPGPPPMAASPRPKRRSRIR